ncbi:hypothetical protein FHT77_001615 [Rhizobium sp. BK181]|nr:hypothetical protein [Rhizobium sp. BK181]
MGAFRDRIDCALERGLVAFRWLGRSAQFPHKLKRRIMDLFICGRRIEIEQGFDVPAHDLLLVCFSLPLRRVASLKSSRAGANCKRTRDEQPCTAGQQEQVALRYWWIRPSENTRSIGAMLPTLGKGERTATLA